MNVNIAHLTRLRKEVEKIDRSILRLLKKRFSVTQQIQGIKQALGLSRHQPEREKELLKQYKKHVARSKVPLGLIQKVFSHIFSYSKRSGIIK